MTKRSTHPVILDNCQIIDLSFLQKQGYLSAGRSVRTTISWNCGGHRTDSIGLVVNAEGQYVELDYACNGKSINYRVPLVRRPSNLGKGYVWYFQYPVTHRLCRKLYGVGEVFLHRMALNIRPTSSRHRAKVTGHRITKYSGDRKS